MDVPLYSMAILTFGVLYLVLGLYLVFALSFTLILLFLYLVLRYEKLPERYPHSASDSLVTTIFISVTWGIFTFLAPKSPIPLYGTGLTYNSASAAPIGAILEIGVAIFFGFLVLGSFLLPRLAGAGKGDSSRAPQRA